MAILLYQYLYHAYNDMVSLPIVSNKEEFSLSVNCHCTRWNVYNVLSLFLRNMLWVLQKWRTYSVKKGFYVYNPKILIASFNWLQLFKWEKTVKKLK